MILDLASLIGLIEHAAAQLPPPAPCPIINGAPIPGCGGVSNIFLTGILPNITLFLLRLVGAASVSAIVWAGMMMIVNMGDDAKVTKARTAILYALLGVTLASVSQIIVSFVVTENYGQTTMVPDLLIGGIMASFVRITLAMVNVTFAFLIVYYGFRMFYAQGKSDEFNRAKMGIFWTVIGALFVNMARQIVLIVTTFFGV